MDKWAMYSSDDAITRTDVNDYLRQVIATEIAHGGTATYWKAAYGLVHTMPSSRANIPHWDWLLKKFKAIWKARNE